MMRVVKPAAISIEGALRNLASRLTGCSTAELPHTQEGIVQFMAENVPDMEDLLETITQEVLDRLAATPDTTEQEARDSPAAPGDTPVPKGSESPDTAAPGAAEKPKRGAKAAK